MMSSNQILEDGSLVGEKILKEYPEVTVIEAEGDVSKKRETKYSKEEFERLLTLYDETFSDLQEEAIVRGVVLKVDKSEDIIDIGYKSEGVIPRTNFDEEVSQGDEIDVWLSKFEDRDGQIVLSKRRADIIKQWQHLEDAAESGELVKGVVIRCVKGGLIMSLESIEAFLPGSQIALRPIRDFEAFVDRELEVKILKLSYRRKNIVVSRRAVLEAERERNRDELLETLAKGVVVEGTVKNVTDFGVFIDLGGLDGLLHITDMSWSRINHPSELVNIGEKIEVKVIEFDEEKERVSLGLKQLTPSPWEIVAEKCPSGTEVKGKVVNITSYGAFVELKEGVEGLVHVSEMSWTKHINHASEVVSVGEEIDVVIMEVDKDDQKISLSIKRLEPDPWENIEERYPKGKIVEGRITNITSFGAFIELEEGIEGLVHISDLSWTKKIMHPSEVLTKNERVEIMILDVDKDNRRISLGYKQLEKNPWPELADRYSEGTETEGKIVRLLEKGLIVTLPSRVEGFVPITQLGQKRLNHPKEAFKEGEVLPLKVIEFDESERKIILSVKAYLQSRDDDEQKRYATKHAVKHMSLKDIASRRSANDK